MISPVIKIKQYGSSILHASLDNLPVQEKIKLEFANLNFEDLTNKVKFENTFNPDSINNLESIEFSLKLDKEEDRFIFIKIYKFEYNSWKEFHVASVVLKEEDEDYSVKNDNGLLSVSKQYVSKNDKIDFNINAKPDFSYDLLIGNRKFGLKTSSDGKAKMSLDTISFLEPSWISGKFVRPIKIQLSDRENKEPLYKSKIEYVPDSLYALATPEDPSRPSCVIMDPDPIAAFSVTSDPLSDFCFPQPLIGDAFKTDGGIFRKSTKLEPKFINCNDGYVSSAQDVVNSGCKIYGQPKFVSFDNPRNFKNDAVSPQSGSPALYGLFGSGWASHRVGFCYSACDINAEEPGAKVDPCSFANQELTKIPRVWVGATSDALNLDVTTVVRGIIKAPPTYFHSILIDNDEEGDNGPIQNGEAINVIFDLSSGERISKTLVYDEEAYETFENFVSAFGAEIESDSNILNADIQVDIYPSSGRIDVKSNTRFYVYPGQIDSVNSATGERLSNSRVKVVKDSKYTLNFEITDPSRSDEIEYALTRGNPTHAVFISGPFKGLVVSLNKDVLNGSINFDTCPRVSSERVGLGTFVVEQDQPCTYVAFVTNNDAPLASSHIVKPLPFVRNAFNEVVPSSNPAMTKDGRVFCQALVNGKWQIFGYFPPALVDYDVTNTLSNYWIQLTDAGENRNVSAASDSYGNVHLAWETDRFGFTSLQYVCIGKSQRLINRLAYSGMFSKQISDELYNKIFNINPISIVENFVEDQSLNITLIRSDGIVSLVEDAYLTGNNFKIIKEFSGYLNIDQEEFDRLIQMNGDAKITRSVANWASGAIPSIDKSTYITSYLIHIDRNGVNSAQNVLSFSAYFSGKILRVYTSSEDLRISKQYVASSSIRYPSNATAFSNSPPLTFGGLNISSDDHSLTFVEYNYILGQSFNGPNHIRVFVEGTHADESLDQSELNRIFTNNGKVSVVSSESICISGSPRQDVAIGTMSINKDYQGNYLQGQESEINFSIHCDCAIKPNYTIDSKATGNDVISVPSTVSSDAVLERSDNTYTWSGSSQPVAIIQEFYGQPGFSQSVQAASSYANGQVVFEDNNKRYFPGFTESSNVSSVSVSIKTSITGAFLNNIVTKEVFFPNAKIMALYIDSDDLAATDGILGNAASSRPYFVTDQNVKMRISPNRQKITFTLSPGSIIDFSIRVVLDNVNISNIFEEKTDKKIEEMFEGYVANFQSVGANNNLFSFASNIFTLNKTDKRYDSIIPLFGSLKFDDLNTNPKAIASKFENFTQLTSVLTDISTSNCNDVSSIGTYEISNSFKVDGDDHNLHHVYVFLVPERVSFIAKNAETINAYQARMGSIDGYREAIVEDVYTGMAKVGMIVNGFASSGVDSSISKGISIKYEDSPSVKIGSSMSFQLDISYLRLSNSDVNLLAAWSHPAEDAYFLPAGSEPYYHIMANLFVNDKPKLSINSQIDMSEKNRQWDFGFGMPFGLNPVIRSYNTNYFELLSYTDWEVTFNNIRIGPPRVSLNNSYHENVNYLYSSSKTFDLVPNLDSNVENDEFEQSILDPGDWICLEDGNLLVDEWSGEAGGFLYVGSYVSSLSGERSVLLEANIPYVDVNSNIYGLLPMYKLRRGRLSTGSGGGISQTLGTFAKDVNEEHIAYITTGLKPVSENLPKMTKSFLINISGNCYAVRSKVKGGSFSGSASPIPLQTNKFSFYPNSSAFDLDIRNSSYNLNKLFSYYHHTTNADAPTAGASHIKGTFYRDSVFFINNNGRLSCNDRKSIGNGTPNFEPDCSDLSADYDFDYGYIAIDSLLRYENDLGQNPFAIAITSTGYLKSITFDGSQLEIPSFALQTNIPSDGGYIGVSVGWDHAAAIKEDGSVSCWGSDAYGQVSNIPIGEKFIQIKCGQGFTVGLKEDGEISVWGRNNSDNNFIVSSVPSGKYIKIDASAEHAVAIGFDGIPVSWGKNSGTSNLVDPQIKLIDVAACGGNVFTLNSGSSSLLSNYSVEPFNVGIDVDGNIVAWGRYFEAFTKISTSTEAQHGLDSIAAPCVAVNRGIRSCILLGADGKLYAYGISFNPMKPRTTSNINTIYKKDNDYFSGGIFVNDCKIYPVSELIEEDMPVESYRMLGLSDDSTLDFTFNLYNSKISTIPLCEKSYILQKSPFIHVDKFDKTIISYEDNSAGPWSVSALSGVYLDRYMQDKILLSESSYSSFNSSIASDNDGKRVVVWNSFKDNSYSIEYAKQLSHPDFSSDCDVDRIISASRILGTDVDPYDPYDMDKSLMSCRVDMAFTAPSFANYIFNIDFKDYENENIIYKSSSSKIEPGKWLINGKFIPYSGQTLDANENVILSYIPDSRDDVFGKVLKVSISYSSEIIAQEEFQISKIHNITDGADWIPDNPKYPYRMDGTDPGNSEYLIFEEASLYSPISIKGQDSLYFETQGSGSGQNFIFPTGVEALPGLSSGAFCKSFLLALIDDGNTNAQFVESSITFSAPIVAVLTDERSLISTDSAFRKANAQVIVNRKGVVSSFQFYSGEYIRLSDDRKTLYFRFLIPRNLTWPDPFNTQSTPPNQITQQGDLPEVLDDGISEELTLEDLSISLSGTEDLSALASSVAFPYATMRIIVSEAASASGSLESVFFCAKPIRSSCRINAYYENTSTDSRNVHFKVSVYSDANYEDSIMVFTSLIDSDLWNSGYDEFPVSGVPIPAGVTGSVSFNPPIINPGKNEYPLDYGNISKSTGLSSSNAYFNLNRRLFICGAQYYIKVSAIYNGQDIELYRSSFLCDCHNDIMDRETSSSWQSPYSGALKTEWAKGNSRKSHPSVAAARDGLFMVAWEDSRNGFDKNGISNRNNIFSDIYSAFIDVNSGKIDSSLYQGYDRIVKNTSLNQELNITEERYPFVVSDGLNNFMIASVLDYNKIVKRYLSVGTIIKPTVIEESSFITACSFTLTDIDRYKSAFEGGEFLNIRVSEKYIKNYSYFNDSIPIPIVDDCFIDLEIVGVPGAMAYRIKNESEIEFTDWIPIGTNIQPLDSLGKSISPDFALFRETFKAKWVGNDIFVAPWVLSKGNGVKRVCIEILTQFGKTQQICLDVIADYSSISYTVDIFHKYSIPGGDLSEFEVSKPIRYNGVPVVNNKTIYKNPNSSEEIIYPIITLSKDDLRSIKVNDYINAKVYVKVTFLDVERIKRMQALSLLNSYIERSQNSRNLSAKVYQQGSSVLSFPLNTLNIEEGTYDFEFTVSKNNGVTFKDGLAFVAIDVPTDCLNPYSKNFSSIARLISDQNLDRSNATLVNNNNFIESYLNLDKRNSFGNRRIN